MFFCTILSFWVGTAKSHRLLKFKYNYFVPKTKQSLVRLKSNEGLKLKEIAIGFKREGCY